MSEYSVTVIWQAGASVKNGPNTGGDPQYVFAVNDTFRASEIVNDSVSPNDPDKKWAKIAPGEQFAGKYVAVRYPSSSGAVVRCLYEPVTDPNPDPVIHPDVLVTVNALATGTLVLVTTNPVSENVQVSVDNHIYVRQD